jgi:thiamine kinase-like enzyme
MKENILEKCKECFPTWVSFSVDDFTFDPPKGFSSFTVGVHCKNEVVPKSVMYRQLQGKKNAILDFNIEKHVFVTLGKSGIAVDFYHYDTNSRIEKFIDGRSLVVEDLSNTDVLKQIANCLYALHQHDIPELPDKIFFELLHDKWGALSKLILEQQSSVFPANEQEMCIELQKIYSDATLEKVLRCIPEGDLTFCHNDTYHGNIMKLKGGKIKLFDFEFSCLNNKCYDFACLFAESVIKHKQEEYPYFKIELPEFGDKELGLLINFYLDNCTFESAEEREKEFKKLLQGTNDMLLLADYKYAMAAIPLSLDPIQKIRFIPYAYQRFNKFLKAYNLRFQKNEKSG